MKLIDGKKIAADIKTEIAVEVNQLIQQTGKRPHLAAILVGNDGASETYIANKIKACHETNIESTLIRLPEEVAEKDLLDKIYQLNISEMVDGFIVQLPLPRHINEQLIIEAIDPAKDVDGFHPTNIGRMLAGLPCFLPATPAGIIELLQRYNIETTGKHCVIVGRSNIVGSPLSVLLSRKAKTGNATVTLCHSYTSDIAAYTLQADILVAALGKPEFITANMVKQGAVVIDVGTTRIESNATKSGWKLTGDVKFDEVAPLCSYITPVPGGVGPMTIAMLLRNTLLAAKKR